MKSKELSNQPESSSQQQPEHQSSSTERPGFGGTEDEQPALRYQVALGVRRDPVRWPETDGWPPIAGGSGRRRSSGFRGSDVIFSMAWRWGVPREVMANLVDKWRAEHDSVWPSDDWLEEQIVKSFDVLWLPKSDDSESDTDAG
jgi:hypothetical protein